MDRAQLEQSFRLTRIGVARRRLRLSRPLATGSATYRRRTVFVLEVDLDVGERSVRGFGEASPLSEWAGSATEDPVAAFERVNPGLEFRDVGQLDDLLPWIDRHPILRFGLECGILDALARAAGVPLRGLLNPASTTRRESIPVQFTLGALDAAASLESLRRASAEGFSHAKLKVGVEEPERELDKILRLADACPELTLRLDANGAWSCDTALRMLRALPAQRIELVEQPVPDADMGDLLGAHDGSGPRIAADESCADRKRVRALIRSGRLGAVVVKPSVVGGLLPACELFALAQRHGVQVIISNLMESAVGRSAIAHLAAAWPELPGPHGLATGGWFAEDLAAAPDSIQRGRLALRPGAGIGFEPVDPA